MYNISKYVDFLVDMGIATEDEINLVTGINGYNLETLEDILYYRTGYHDFEQFREEICDYED